jgi:predicted AAA+ superfamily ATPase
MGRAFLKNAAPSIADHEISVTALLRLFCTVAPLSLLWAATCFSYTDKFDVPIFVRVALRSSVTGANLSGALTNPGSLGPYRRRWVHRPSNGRIEHEHAMQCGPVTWFNFVQKRKLKLAILILYVRNANMKQRHAKARLEAAIVDTPVVLVTGPRQAGKSTLVRTLEGYDYVTLDEAGQLQAAKASPKGFIDALTTGVIIDEIQRAPELILAIKSAVDQNRQPGRFLLTGSANVMALPETQDSLAGRIEHIAVYPFTRREIDDMTGAANPVDVMFDRHPRDLMYKGSGIEDLPTLIAIGGYPEIVTRSLNRRGRWFESYLQALLDRDVRDLVAVQQPSHLVRLLQILAAQPAEELNMAGLATALQVSQPTVKRYLVALETVFLLRLVAPWSNNLTNRLVKTPKVHFIDTGFMSHLAGINGEGLKKAPSYFGHALETYVVSQLMAHIAWADTSVRLFHYRSRDGREIDVILERSDRKIIGIEIKSSKSVQDRDFKSLRRLKAESPDRFLRGFVAYDGKQLIGHDEDLFAIPIGWLI